MPLEESSSGVSQPAAVSATPAVVPQTPPPSNKFRPVNVSKRGLLLLSAVAVIFLIILVFVLSSDLIFKPKQGQSTVGRSAGFQQEQLEKQKTYLGYVSLFEQTLADYKTAPSDGTKATLREIAEDAKKDFPGEYKEVDFLVPCMDEKCLNTNADQQITALVSALKESKADPYVVEIAVKDLISLKSYETLEDAREIVVYNQAHTKAVSVLDSDKTNDRLKTAILDFEKFISKKFPEQYRFYKQRNGYRLTNEVTQE